MSFRMIEPETIDDTAFVSSTVPENDAVVWDATTDFAIDDEVMVTTGTHAVFRAAAASGPGNGGAVDPATDTLNTAWVNIRSTNPWRAFDQYVGDPTVQIDAVSWVLQAVGVVDSVALFGVAASTVTVVVVDSGAVEIYNETHSLQDESGVVDLYSYLYSPIVRAPHIVVTDIPPCFGGTVTITVEAPGSDVEVGQVVIGRQEELGRTIAQVPLGIEDFSRKDQDDEFGRTLVTERDYTNLMTIAFAFPTSRAEYLRQRIASRRAKLTVYASDSRFRDNDYASYGFYQTFRVTPRIAAISEGSMELESIT